MTATLCPTARTYAIGDIHGNRVQFEAMLRAIEIHAAGRPHRIITVGDYCDRGPDSKGAYDILMGRLDIVALRGNHEQMFLEAHRGGRSDVFHWCRNGGVTTLISFGLEQADDVPRDPGLWNGRIPYWVEATRAAPKAYMEWIDSLPLYVEDEHRVFVHAGLQPGISDMSRMTEETFLWIRDPFLRHEGPFHKYVVHGHTPQVSGHPEIRPNRINLDTCCFGTGILCCAIFGPDEPGAIGLMFADGKGEVSGAGDALTMGTVD